VINGDIYTDFPFDSLSIAPAHDAHLILVPNPPQHVEGDFGLGHGVTLPDGSPRFTFGGIAVYRTAFFDGYEDGVRPLKPLLLRSMAARRCGGELYQGRWEDVGTPARLAALNGPAASGES
jgi:MurNAc alpha-1-phosphate uridylyltransferase